MKSKEASKIVARWFNEVAIGANEKVYLNVDTDRCYISDASGVVVTSRDDCADYLDAKSLSELALLCEKDLV